MSMMTFSQLGDIPERVRALRARHALRDTRNAEVQAVRRGQFEAIAPDLFSEDFRRPVVANLIDTTARDTAAVLAPLPSFNCTSGNMLTDVAKKFADKRGKVANNYVWRSHLPVNMLTGADQYISYGLLVLCVEPDFESNMPRIKVEDAIGAYPVWNSKGETVELARVFMKDWMTLCADYPQLEHMRQGYPNPARDGFVEVVKYTSASRIVVYLPQMGNAVLEDMPNPLGKCYYVAARRPGLDDEIRGFADDIIWVQFARHRLEMLTMEGVEKAIRAPIAVPDDVQEVPYGADVIIPSRNPQAIQRVRLDVPAQAFSAGELLKEELRLGAMSPEARGGDIGGSVITGRGIEQLMAGFSSQIAAAQTVFKDALERALSMCFEMDETIWPNLEKEIRGKDAGVPYQIKYTPGKDIRGDYTIDATYGFAAGMDPNRALVFLLQAQGAGIISKEYLARNLPVDINATEEQSRIAVEEARNSILLGFSALTQAIPQLAASGQDPSEVIRQQARFIELMQKGESVESAATMALAPPAPPPGAPGQAGEPGPGGGGSPGPQGFSTSGLPGELRPGLASEGPNGRPDLNMLLAGLSSSGSPNLAATVSRRNPVPGQ